jgi:hypothetical protein
MGKGAIPKLDFTAMSRSGMLSLHPLTFAAGATARSQRRVMPADITIELDDRMSRNLFDAL